MSQIEQTIDDMQAYIDDCKSPTFGGGGKVICEKDVLENFLEDLRSETPEEIKKYQHLVAQKDSIIANAEAHAQKGFEWIGAYDITADELLAGTDTAKTESKTAQAQMLILELLADGKRMPSAELEKAVNERGISSRTMRTAKSRIGDRLVTEKDGTAWVCYLRD